MPHAGARAEPIPGDNVETAYRAAHPMPFGDPIQKAKDVPGALLDAEVLCLNVRAFDRPNFGVCFAHRLQRSERDRFM